VFQDGSVKAISPGLYAPCFSSSAHHLHPRDQHTLHAVCTHAPRASTGTRLATFQVSLFLESIPGRPQPPCYNILPLPAGPPSRLPSRPSELILTSLPRQVHPVTLRIPPRAPGIICLLSAHRPHLAPELIAEASIDFNRFHFNGFTYFLTLFSKFFSSFPHGTCSLSGSCPYLALDGLYHPFWAAFPNNPTLRKCLISPRPLRHNWIFTISDVLFQGTSSAAPLADNTSPNYNSVSGFQF